jgi:hypothetical protein
MQIFRLAALYEVLVDQLFVDLLRTIRSEIQALKADVLVPDGHEQ